MKQDLHLRGNDLRAWLIWMEELGADLPDELVAELEKRASFDEALHTRSPLIAVASLLMSEEWRSFMRDSRWILEDVTEVLVALLAQEAYYPAMKDLGWSRETMFRRIDDVSLLARRYLLARSVGSTIGSPGRLSDVIPRASSSPGRVVYDHVRPSEASRVSIRCSRLLLHRFIFSEHVYRRDLIEQVESEEELKLETPDDRCPDEEKRKKRASRLHECRLDREAPRNPDAYRHYVTEASCTRNYACHSFIEPIALHLYREAVGFVSSGLLDPKLDQLALHLTVLFGLEHGIPPRDVPNIGFSKEESPLAWVDLNGEFGFFRLQIGSHYYRAAARAFAPEELALPMSKQLTTLLKHTRMAYHERDYRRTSPSRTTYILGDLIPNLYPRFRDAWTAHRKRHFQGYDTDSLAVHHVWQTAGLLDVRLSRPYLGLLCGRPSTGGAVECSYVCADYSTLLDASIRLRIFLRNKAGIGLGSLPSAEIRDPASGALYGTPVPQLSHYWQGTIELIERAETHNEVIACVVRFLRGLGLRYSSWHYHPIQYYSPYPQPCLEILDKKVNGADRPRYLPISTAIGELIAACAELIPHSPYLLYEQAGFFVPYHELRSKRSLRDYVREFGARQPGRTAFYNELLQRGCGEAIRNALMGHGSTIFQPYTEHGLLALNTAIDECAEVLRKIYDEVGINRAAVLLRDKIARLPRHGGLRAFVKPAEMPKHGITIMEDGQSGEYTPSPLATSELAVYHRARRSLFRAGADGSLRGLHQLFLCLTLIHGIPAENLRKFRMYYRFGSFAEIPQTGDIYFLALMEHEDKGGLSVYPIHIGHSSESVHPTLVVLRHLWNRVEVSSRGSTHRALVDRLLFAPGGGANFPDIDDESIGRAFRRIAVDAKDHRLLSSADANTCLERLSNVVAGWVHPGIAAGALRGYSRRGLNNYDVISVVRIRHALSRGASLRFLLAPDEPWRMPYAAVNCHKQPRVEDAAPALKEAVSQLWAACTRVPRSGWHRSAEKAGSQSKPPEEWRLEQALDEVVGALDALGAVPIHSWLRDLLRAALPSGRGSQASGLAQVVFTRMVVSGRGRLSSPITLLNTEEYESFVSAAAQRLSTYAPKVASPDLARAISTSTASLIRLLAASGMRSREPLRRQWGEVVVVNQSLFIFVGQGKTVNSRRVVDLNRVLPGVGKAHEVFVRYWKQNLRMPRRKTFFSTGRKRPTTAMTILRTLSEVASAKYSAHSLRHQVAWLVAQRALMKEWHTGNYHTHIATLSRTLGHGSVGVTEYSYIGTAVAALQPMKRQFAAGPTLSPELADQLVSARIQSVFPSVRDAWRELGVIAIGHYRASQSLRYEVRACQKAVLMMSGVGTRASRRASGKYSGGAGAKPSVSVTVYSRAVVEGVTLVSGEMEKERRRLVVFRAPEKCAPDELYESIVQLVHFALSRGVSMELSIPYLGNLLAASLAALAGSNAAELHFCHTLNSVGGG